MALRILTRGHLLMAEMKPTPAPAMRRPTTITARVVDAVSKIQPTEKVTHPVIIVHLRPMRSAISPEIMAPKNVPQERIPVRRDCCHPGRTKRALMSSLAPEAGYWEVLEVCTAVLCSNQWSLMPEIHLNHHSHYICQMRLARAAAEEPQNTGT